LKNAKTITVCFKGLRNVIEFSPASFYYQGYQLKRIAKIFSDILGLGGPGRGAWIASKDDQSPWFNVNFREWREVRGIITQVNGG